MNLSRSSADMNTRLHYEIGYYQTQSNKRSMSAVRIAKQVANALFIPEDLGNIDSSKCRGMSLNTSPHDNESHEKHDARSQSMDIWVVDRDYSSILLINHYPSFEQAKFIEIFNSAVNDRYNDKKRVTLSSGAGYYGGQNHLYTKVDKSDRLVVFELFKKLLLSAASFTYRHGQSEVVFEKDLNTLFGIEAMKLDIRKAEIETLFTEKKDFDAVYNILLSDAMLPHGKGEFLEYGKRLRTDGDYEQAIRFLNSEHPSHVDTYNKAQMQVFEILGDILSQDMQEQFLAADERRQYQSNRIELARKLERTNPTIAGLADKLFCEYAGFPTVGEKPRFSLKSDPFQLALQLADELYKERIRNQQPQQIPASPKSDEKD